MSLFNELKRRNVFRVGIAYIIAAWLVLQFADVVLNNIEAPPWVFQAIMLLLGIGLLFAVFFAWAFELTPEGIKKEKDVDRTQSITQHTGRKLDFTIIAVLVVALGFFAYDKFVVQAPTAAQNRAIAGDGEQSPDQAVVQSIAVLPFADMSPAKDNEYFTDGLTEELLNILGNIKSLQVAGRTSSFAFKGKNEDLRSIGEKLNVKTLLEGSVRKDDERQKVRVTVQLINVADGYHLWSKSYDRDLEDIFAIQEEIAREVASALKITLLGEEQEKITKVARSDMNAYDLYLQGRSSLAEFSFTSLPRAVDEFEQSIALDPDYLPAQLGLAETYLQMEDTGVMGREEAFGKSADLLTNILESDPENVTALALLARRLLNDENPDVAKAEKYLRIALTQNPRDISALSSFAGLLNLTNRGSETVEYMQKVVMLEPYSADAQFDLCLEYLDRREIDLALKRCQKVREISPGNPNGFYATGRVYRETGQLDQFIYWEAQAAAIDPRDPEIPVFLVRAWLDLDDLQQAQLWLDKAIAIDPEHAATISARILMLKAQEQYAQASQLAHQAYDARLDDRQDSHAIIHRVLIPEYLAKGKINEAVQLLREIIPEAAGGAESTEIPFDELRQLSIAQLLLIDDSSSRQATEILASVQQHIGKADRANSEAYWLQVTALEALIRGDGDAAVDSLMTLYDLGGLRNNWRDSFAGNYIWADLVSHPGFQQIITMLEAEAVTQRENAYKLLASLE